MSIKNEKKRQDNINILKSVINELKKVTWPTKKELIIYSIVVIFIIFIFTIIIYIYDFSLTKLIKILFYKK